MRVGVSLRGGVLVLCLVLGGCIIHKGDLQWEPPILSKEGCPNIEGTYKNLGSGDTPLSSMFVVYEPYRGETIPVSYVRLLPVEEPTPDERELKEVQAKMLALDSLSLSHYERGKQWTALRFKADELRSRILSSPKIKKREEEFKQSRVQIERHGQTLEMTTLTVADDPPRFKKIMNLKHPWVGCRDGALVVRGWRSYGANEGNIPCSTSIITERVFRKLSDGTLEVQFHGKHWRCTLRGEPYWKGTWVYLYSPAP